MIPWTAAIRPDSRATCSLNCGHFRSFKTPNQVLMLYQYQRVWRVIWTDGRELPKDRIHGGMDTR